MEGEVIVVGPRRPQRGREKFVALDVKASERILFGKWSGTAVKFGGEELLIMEKSDIMGPVEGMSRPSRKRRRKSAASMKRPHH